MSVITGQIYVPGQQFIHPSATLGWFVIFIPLFIGVIVLAGVRIVSAMKCRIENSGSNSRINNELRNIAVSKTSGQSHSPIVYSLILWQPATQALLYVFLSQPQTGL